VKQHVRFCTAADGVLLAYAVHGSGPPLVRVATWLSHLELDWESPVWRHWLQRLGERHTLLRYDERGCGLSDTSIGDPSVDVWLGDLETVIDAAGLERFALLGVSQGAAIAVAYAARHPDRVSDLVLYGGYARGRRFRGQDEEEDAIVGAIRAGWKAPNPAFRRVFGALFLPNGTPEQMAWYEDLLWRTTTAAAATGLFRARGGLNVCELAPQVRARTLVMHARDDRVVPVEEGRLLAADSGRALGPAGVRQPHLARVRTGLGRVPL
jgi:pimeloyl-ACP methyl ester carboxylesterase